MNCYDKIKIETAAKIRKEGYIEEIIKRDAKQDENKYCLEPEDVDYMRKHFKIAEQSQLPSLPQLVKNATAAAVQEVQARIAKEPPIPVEEQNKRLEICRACEFFTPNIPELDEAKRKQERCVKCGCYMSFKTKLRSQHCPINKW